MPTTPTADGAIAGIDIDGVLADPTHRLHHLNQRPKNWSAFFADAHLDTALAAGLAAVNELVEAGIRIFYVSGRPRYMASQTESWLARHDLPDGPMYLRPARDYRPAPELKLAVYQELAQDYDIYRILDDDVRVFERLRDEGFPVVLADWYRPDESESDTLSRAQDRQGRT